MALGGCAFACQTMPMLSFTCSAKTALVLCVQINTYCKHSWKKQIPMNLFLSFPLTLSISLVCMLARSLCLSASLISYACFQKHRHSWRRTMLKDLLCHPFFPFALLSMAFMVLFINWYWKLDSQVRLNNCGQLMKYAWLTLRIPWLIQFFYLFIYLFEACCHPTAKKKNVLPKGVFWHPLSISDENPVVLGCAC